MPEVKIENHRCVPAIVEWVIVVRIIAPVASVIRIIIIIVAESEIKSQASINTYAP
jgi:hypothetical protein